MTKLSVRPAATFVVLLVAVGTWIGVSHLVKRSLEYSPRVVLPDSNIKARGFGNPKGSAERHVAPGLSPNGKAFALLVYPEGWDSNENERKSELRIYDVETGQERRRISSAVRLDNVTYSPDSKWLLGEQHVWDVETGEVWIRFESGEVAQNAKFSPDGRTLAVLDVPPHGGPVAVKLIDLATRREILRIKNCDRFESVRRMAFSSDSKRMAMPVSGETYVVELPDGRVRKLINSATILAFSPDGMTLATGGVNLGRGPEPESVRLWNCETLDEKAGPLHSHKVAGLAFAAKGTLLVSWTEPRNHLKGNFHELKAWDVAALKEVLRVEHAVSPPSFLAGGSILVTEIMEGDKQFKKLWSLTRNGGSQIFGKLPNHVANRDGRFLITLTEPSRDNVGRGMAIHALDTEARQSEKVLLDSKIGNIETGGITSDGKYLVAAGSDAMLVHELVSEKVLALVAHGDDRFDITNDSRSFVSWSPDGGSIKVWDLSQGEPTGFRKWVPYLSAILVLLFGLPVIISRKPPTTPSVTPGNV